MDFERILQQRGILEVKHHIENNYGGVISSNEAVRLLYQLCKTLTKNEQSYEVNPLLEFIVLCCKNVHNLIEAEVNPFLMSIYHFVKFYFKQKMLDNVLILCDLVKTHCLDVNVKSDMYGYYVQLLTREIFTNSKEHNGNTLHQTVMFSIKCELLFQKCDEKSLSGRLISYPFLFRHPHITSTQRNNFCLDFIQTLRSIEIKSDIQIDIFKSFVNVFYMTLVSISCENIFPIFIQKTLEKILTIMYEKFQNKKFNSCIEILSLFFQGIIQDVTNFNKKNAIKLKECNENLSRLYKTHGTDQTLTITCSQIGKMLKILIDHFGKVRENWNNYFPFIQLLDLFELIEIIVSKNTFDVEKCCEKCNLKSDVFNSISSSAISVDFLNVVIRQKGVDCLSNEIHQVAIRIIRDCCKNIEILKGKDCEKYSSFWKFVGLHTYNISVALYKIKNYKNSKLYTDILLRNIVAMEGISKSNICFKDALGATLHLHSTNCLNLEEKTEAMLYLVLTMLLSKEYRKKAMWTWILVKSNQQSDDEIKAITVNNILFSQQDKLRTIIPQFKYNRKSAEDLLIFELHYYSENWLSRIPIISCCNELLKISTDIFVKTKALLLSYDKFLVMFDSQIISSVQETIHLIQSKPYNFSYNICLSLLKFILYQFKFHETILKNLDDMNKAFIPLKSVPLQPFEEPPNPNDKCDIVPAFINLNLNSLQSLYEHLDDCLKLWSTIFEKKLTEAELLLLKDYKILKTIKSSAFEFRLHHFQVQMINAWILYYKLAEILDDKFGMLEGIGFILEYADCKTKEIVRLEKIAEELIHVLDRDDREDQEYMYCLTTFYVNKSAGYLKNELVAEAYEYFCSAQKYFAMCDRENNICEARILHLKTQFLLMPCFFNVLKHQENVLIVAQAAYTCIAEIYKINSLKCAYTTSILFEISLSNGWIYKYLRLPREVRCYSKESVILAQKCLLPMRTAQFLSLLAFTDLLDRQYMDCEVKLSGLLKILCSPNNQNLSNPVISVTSCTKDVKTEINCDTENNTFFQMVLHVPNPEPQRITSSELGSPNLRKKPFVHPDFVSHARNCNCYICRNYEYQKLIFDTVHLESLINFYQGDRKQAENFFNGGILLHKKLQSKIQSSNPITFMKSNQFIFTRLCRNISTNYCTFLLDYSYFLIQKSDFQNASKILEDITSNNEYLKYMNFPFWNEVILQKTNLSIQKENNLFIEIQTENIEPELLVVVNTIVSTTPENKISRNSIAVCISPGIKSKVSKHVKKIQFDLSDSDSDQENQGGKQKSPENHYFKIKTPGKTPAPKIKIYTPKTVKQPKRTASKIPKPDVERKISPKGNKRTLEERTKLLTEKLKASQKTSRVEEKKKVDRNRKDDLEKVTESIETLTLNPKEFARKKYKKIIQPDFSSSSLSSVDSPTMNTKNKKILGSRIQKVNISTASSSSDNVTRKSTRTRK